MKLTLFFKNIKHTPSIDHRIEQKSEHLSKYFNGGFEVQWFCYTKLGVHSADVCVIGPKYRYRASAASENLYKCFDLVMDKLEKQLYRKKEKVRDRIHRGKNSSKQQQIIQLFKEENRVREIIDDEAS